MVNNYKVTDRCSTSHVTAQNEQKALRKKQTKAQSVLFYLSLSVNRSTYSVYDVLIKILAESQLAFYWEVVLKELLCRSFYYSFIALRCKQSRKKHSLKLFAGVVSL